MSDPTRGDVRAGDLQAGDARAGDARAGDAQVGDAQANDVWAGEVKAGGVQTGDVRVGGAVVTVFSTPDCHLCHEALAELNALRAELAFELRECDITRDEALHRAYFERIPVISLDGEELFDYVVDEQILRERLESRT